MEHENEPMEEHENEPIRRYKCLFINKEDAFLPEHIFDPPLALLNPYDAEDTHQILALLDDCIFTIPIFYIEGVVQLPVGAELYLKAIQVHSKNAVEHAMICSKNPYLLGMVRVYRDMDGMTHFGTTGTIAKIAIYSRLSGGSLHVLTHVKQRFRLRRHWINNGLPIGEVQIIKEDHRLWTPRHLFGKLPSLSREKSTSSNEDKFACESEPELERADQNGLVETFSAVKGEGRIKVLPHRASRVFLPYWVYGLYDPYCLAQRAADLWKHAYINVGEERVKNLVKEPGALSFYIASEIPVSESERQELLDMDGITYRLRREIELLESLVTVKCKNCQSERYVGDGHVGIYTDPHGDEHEVMTLKKANGMAFVGWPVKEYSWFPGYEWMTANCATCKTKMGWHFKSRYNKMVPKSFWAIRT